MIQDIKSSINKLDELLDYAIKSHIKGRVGLYYSGGIDSSLIDTYGGKFEKITYNYGDYAEEFKTKFPQIMKVIGQPIKSFSPIGWWKLGEEAKKQGLKIVFSGEGADELFGGYVRWVPQAADWQAQQMYPSYKSMFPKAADVNKIGKEAFYGDLQFLLDAERKIAAHHGLQIIFPFLDKKIIEFAWSLPPEFKIWNMETKVILRRLLEKRNPNYKHIEKKGLYCNVNSWIGSKDGYGKKDYLKLQNDILENDYNRVRPGEC